MLTDIELIDKVKKDGDSSAISELVARHTGVYVFIASKYLNGGKIPIQDVKNDVMSNIYDWVLDYDPSRGMKFSTYVGDRTRYMCMDLINRTPDKIEIDESTPMPEMDGSPTAIDQDALTEVRRKAQQINDPRFITILNMRFPEVGVPKTWREIGKIMGVTHERARQIFNDNLDKIGHRLSTGITYYEGLHTQSANK